MTDQALKQLLQSMSIEEKAGQLAQIPISVCMEGVSRPTGPMQEYRLTPEQIALSGSLIADNIMEAEPYARVVKELRERHPHHIPPLVMKDVIHGHRTMFPIPLAIGSSFDERIAESMARCGAKEAAACGAHVTFAPMVDVVRDPRWGRVMESPGESPTLCSAMGAAMVRGTKDHLAACVKHFAGYGLCQAGQEYAPIDVSRTELYNTYFPPFQAAIDAGAELVMPCFAAIDRIPCVCSSWLLQDILRKRMAFDGVVISDWDDPRQLINHGIAEDLREAAQLCIHAGLDIDMMSFAYLRELACLVREGIVTEELLDTACLHVLRLKNRLGLFEKSASQDAPAKLQHEVCASSEIRREAYHAAVSSCVLLKNEQVLPLGEGTKVALVGPHARTHAILGGWTLDADVKATKTLENSFQEDRRLELTDERQADIILFACGENQFETGEATSKTQLALPPEQMKELKRLHNLGKPVVMLLFCGRPLILTEALPFCAAILNCWFPGSEGADAIRALVTGDESPCGHLSMTFPRAIGQIPIHHDRLTTARPYQKGVHDVNRYLDESNDPLYPFGYSQSYTSFEISNLAIGGSQATVCIRNIGSRTGAAVVQVYARLRHSSLLRPSRRLVAWKKETLAPGEMHELRFPLTKGKLRTYDADGKEIAIQGICDLAIGMDSNAPWNLRIDTNQMED